MTRLIICCCSCENDVLTVFTVTDLNLLSPVSRKVPGHLSKKKGDLPSESIESRGEFSWRTNYRRWLQSGAPGLGKGKEYWLRILGL